MFTTMMLAAENSTLTPFFRQIIRAMVMVSMVRSSSSSRPKTLRPIAATACRTAKIWMIHAVFMLRNVVISIKKVSEDRNFAPIMQFLAVVRLENTAVRQKLPAIRQINFASIIYNDYFRKLVFTLELITKNRS